MRRYLIIAGSIIVIVMVMISGCAPFWSSYGYYPGGYGDPYGSPYGYPGGPYYGGYGPGYGSPPGPYYYGPWRPRCFQGYQRHVCEDRPEGRVCFLTWEPAHCE